MFDTESLLGQGGLLFLIFSVYAQSGLFFCFFLPSGGFMFTAGALVAAGDFNYSMPSLCFFLTIAAIAGNVSGYWFGKKAAPYIYSRKDSRFFKQEYLTSAQHFFEKHEGMALSVASFFPLVRTFVPIVAGIIKIDIRRFLFFSIVGSVAYVCSFLFAGYLIGKVPLLKPYLHYIIIAIILALTIPVVRQILTSISDTKKN